MRIKVKSILFILIFLATAQMISCSSGPKKYFHEAQKTYPSYLFFRRPIAKPADPQAGPGGEDYHANPPPSANLDCQPLSELTQAFTLSELRECLKSIVPKDPLKVDYVFKDDVQPSYILEEEKDTPACLKTLMPRIPVPREIIYQVKEENGADYQCYVAGLVSGAGQVMGSKIPVKKPRVQISFPLGSNPQDDAELLNWIHAWSLAPFWNAEESKIKGKFLPKHLCKTCVGEKNLLKYGEPEPPSWPDTELPRPGDAKKIVINPFEE